MNNNKIMLFDDEYDFLSNMYKLSNPIHLGGITYPSSENAYQAMKFDEIGLRKEIAKLTPHKSKTKARKYLERNGWHSIKESVTLDVGTYGNYAKELLNYTGDDNMTISYKKHPIIIAGSRDFKDIKMMIRELKEFCKNKGFKPSDIQIVSGTAKGADSMGEVIADYYNIDVKRYKPDWDKHGNMAGHIRNEHMAQYASKMKGSCLLFWNGESTGTLNMIETCKSLGIEYKIINTETYWEEEKKKEAVKRYNELIAKRHAKTS